jgi:hypothetical protein
MSPEDVKAISAMIYERQAPATATGEYPYSQLQHIGFFILFFFPALALLVVGLRMYSRISTKTFGWGK